MRRSTQIVAFTLIAAVAAYGQGFSPRDAVARMKVADGLRVRLVASEPLVRQPVAISFDDRGRLWVLQYLQYPNPAGLKAVEVDRYLRTKYDRKPEPPPRGPRGQDRLTILSDTDGDGVMDSAKDFVGNLNLATGFAHGYGGVFVLQAPYLLFYPDLNGDDVPDGDPEVLLDGFGMEDSHALANSLTWGPDGWLYGAQGSTVTAHVRGITFQQGIWRYHPRTKKFELFAEGGGNTWGLDFNRWGDVIAGTNYGGAAMLHQVQGAYYVKGFEKHGPLQNPFAYGYFEHVPYRGFIGGHVTCGGIVYQGGALPAQFNDQYIAANLLSNAIHWHEIQSGLSTFKNRLGGELLLANDTWFRPIDCEVGPDGAVYIADWTDKRANHVDPQDDWDRTNGRIYAIESTRPNKVAPFDLAKMNSSELAAMHRSSNVWFERKAKRLLAERLDSTVAGDLERIVRTTNDEFTHKAFWMLNACRPLDEATLAAALEHANEHVRFWAVRFIGDEPDKFPGLHEAIARRAAKETSCRVRMQMACSAKRLPAPAALSLVKALIRHDEDRDDPFIPLLLWWAVEKQCEEHSAAVLDWAQDRSLWARATFHYVIQPRLARRFAAVGKNDEFKGLAVFLETANRFAALQSAVAAATTDLAPQPGMPKALEKTLEAVRRRAGDAPTFLQFGLAFHQGWAVTGAVAQLSDPKAPLDVRKALLGSICRAVPEAGVTEAVRILNDDRAAGLHGAAVAALRPFSDSSVGQAILARATKGDRSIRQRCIELLTSRTAFAELLVAAVEAGKLPAAEVAPDDLQRMAAFKNAALLARMERIWGRVAPETSGEKKARVHGIKVSLNLAKGDPTKGHQLFKQHCANCHTLFGEGAKVGPELTGADRKNLDFLLTSIVDPSAVIRKEFMSHAVATTDGRTLNGLIAESTPSALTLIDSKAQKIVIPQSEVEAIKPSSTSLMPERLLDALDAQAVRDLVSYLQSNPPAAVTSRK